MARRVLYAVLSVWGAVSIIFVVVRIVPGDPASLMLGPSATASQVAALREQLGLNQPLIEQYLRYLVGVLHFDFGTSITFGVPAASAVLERVPATAELGVAALVLALLISFPLGILTARARGSLLDRGVRLLSLTGQSLPTFWVGIVLILIFARYLRLLPSFGDADPLNFVLPTITLALPLVATIILLVRGGLLDVFDEPYIQTARSKGLRERAVVLESRCAEHAHPGRHGRRPDARRSAWWAGRRGNGFFVARYRQSDGKCHRNS